MRILSYVTNFLHLTETFIYNEVTALSAQHEVEVVCIKRLNSKRFPFQSLVQVPYKQYPGKGVLRLFLEDHNWGYISYYSKQFSEKINQLIDQLNPDIIHCQFGTEAARFLENFSRSDIPIFVTFHGNDASEKLRSTIYCKRITPLLSRNNVFPIFVSKFLRDNFLNTIPLKKHFLVYCGINLNHFQRTENIATDPFVFLQVSSFREKKGHEYTVQAFKDLLVKHPHVNCKLVLAGDGPLLNKIKQLCQSLNISHLVEFPGFLNSDQAREWMQKAHAFVHHSVTASNGDTEGLPTAIMEAMAMELPVLSTYHSGIPELVEDGVNGYLVQEKEITLYASKMREIMDWGYVSANRTKIMEMCEINNHTSQLSNLYADAIKALKS